MAVRTANVTGTITNTGDIASTFRVRLFVWSYDIEGLLKESLQADSTNVVLAAGASGAIPATSKATSFAWPGGHTNAQARLDRVAPAGYTLDGVAFSGTISSPNAAAVPGGAFVPTVTVTRLVGQGAEAEFKIAIGQAVGGGFPMPLVVGVGALAGLVAVGLMQRGRGR